MVQSKYTDQVRISNQRSSRGGARIDRIILHHQASTNDDATIDLMVSGRKQVSSNYTVSNEGRATLVVPEEYRAWTSSSAHWDGRAITFEIENESSNGWTVSSTAHEKVARICADVAIRYGFPLNRDTVIGHRELYTRYGASYATACPGSLNMDWIVNRANQIIREGVEIIMPLNQDDKNFINGALSDGGRNFGPLFHQFQMFSDLNSNGWQWAFRADKSPVVADGKTYVRGTYFFAHDTHRRLFGDSQKDGRVDQGGQGGILDEILKAAKAAGGNEVRINADKELLIEVMTHPDVVQAFTDKIGRVPTADEIAAAVRPAVKSELKELRLTAES